MHLNIPCHTSWASSRLRHGTLSGSTGLCRVPACPHSRLVAPAQGLALCVTVLQYGAPFGLALMCLGTRWVAVCTGRRRDGRPRQRRQPVEPGATGCSPLRAVRPQAEAVRRRLGRIACVYMSLALHAYSLGRSRASQTHGLGSL